MTLDAMFHIIVAGCCAAAMFGMILNIAALMTWVERKLSAMIQDRVGPNRANIRLGRFNFTLIGLIHIMCDPIKLFVKEDFVPEGANKALHTLAPVIGLVIPIVVFVVIPFAGPWRIQLDQDIRKERLAPVILILERGMGDRACEPGKCWVKPSKDVWLIGPLYDQNSKVYMGDWPVIGDHFKKRVLTSKDLSPIYQITPPGDALHLSNYTVQFVVADLDVGMLFIFGIASLAVYGVILAGWSSNNKFSFLGAIRGANQMIGYEVGLGLCAVGIFMIYGSVSLGEIVAQQGELLWGVVPKWGIVTQPLAFALFLACGMAEIKRPPFDIPEGESEIIAGYFLEYSSTKFTMFMFGEFVEMIFLAAVLTTLFLGGWQIPGISAAGFHWWFIDLSWTAGTWSGLAVSLLQAAKFTATLVLVLYAIFMIRWTFPRFRYDQVMKMGWKMVLPLAIVNIMVTGVVIAFTRGWL